MLELWQRVERLAAWWYYHRVDRARLESVGIEFDCWMSEAFIAMTEAAKAFRADGNFIALYAFYLRKLYRDLLPGVPDAISLDAPVDGLDDVVLGDRIQDDTDGIGDILDRDDLADLHSVLDGALGDLPDIEAAVVQRMYYQDKTKQQTAAELGLSASRITSAHSRALYKLRHNAGVRRYVEQMTPWMLNGRAHIVEDIVVKREHIAETAGGYYDI